MVAALARGHRPVPCRQPTSRVEMALPDGSDPPRGGLRHRVRVVRSSQRRRGGTVHWNPGGAMWEAPLLCK